MSRGKQQKSLELVAACEAILAEIQPATVRAVCYRLFVNGAIPDMGKLSTARVSRQLTWAREEEHIPWEWIVDETRSPERTSSWDDTQSFMNAVKRSYRKNLWADQDERVEVWSEKGTVRGTLGPVLRGYGVTFRVMHGFGSATSVHEAAEDSQRQPFTALYVGDYDPSGMHMSEVDLPERLERYDAEIDIVRVALLSADTLNLPDFPASDKVKDPRCSWFRSRYGERCWELDAMSPVDLRNRVAEEIQRRIDVDAWELAQKTEEAELSTIKTVVGNWKELVASYGATGCALDDGSER